MAAAAPPPAIVPEKPAAEASGAIGSANVTCTTDDAFPGSLDLPEASAAAEVELAPGSRELVIVSDSGNHGVAAAMSLDGKTVRKLSLPLDPAAGDDLEGAAFRDGHLYTLTSSGAVQRFSGLLGPGGGTLQRDGSAYRLGAPPASCDKLDDVNCGRNYEGLCLRAKHAGAPRWPCDGYAAGRATGALYCVNVDANGRLSADATKAPIKLAVPPDSLSDCAFGSGGGPAEEVLLVTTNIKGGDETYVVDPKSFALAKIDAPTTLNNEAIAVDHAGALYTFMDTNGSPSPSRKAACEGWK